MASLPGDTARPRRADDRLLEIAVAEFGRKGVEGVSTRDLARKAETVMSSITYHYGGKDGLYLAAAEFVAGRMGDRLAAIFNARPPVETLGPAEAVEELCHLMETAMRTLIDPRNAPYAQFILREQTIPGAGFEIIYERLLSRVAARLTGLVGVAAAGRWGAEEVRVRSVAIFGQILVFRAARLTVMRVTGWDEITEARARLIRDVVSAHVRAMLAVEEIR